MKSAENYLIDMYFSGKPLIELEVLMIQYTDEQQINTSTQLLKQKLYQEELNNETKNSILKEITTPSQARSALELLETCINFLQATGGSIIQHLSSNVGNMTLGSYVKSVLLLSGEEFGWSNAISNQVQLKHIEALYLLLRSQVSGDLFSSVHKKYKVELETNLINELNINIQYLDLNILLPCLREFIISQLAEEHISINQSMLELIGYLEYQDSYLNDLPWIKYFPKNITMKYCLNTFKYLEQAAQH